MLKKINWSNFSPQIFQTFCNILLSFEISKQVMPYGAEGKDGGIDANFDGNYDGKDGKWRFQYKFHTLGRSKSLSALKSDIKNDIRKNLGQENNLIFLTNVELLPPDIVALNEVAQDEINKKSRSVHFEIWDGEKLFTFLIRYPLIGLWLDEGFSSQLAEYKIAFRDQLVGDINTSNYTFNNYFVSRIDKIDELRDLILSPDKHFAIVTGDAGIGKTRLCIEFFKKYIDSDNDWIPLVLVNYTFDFDKIKKSITSNKNYIILVDDAHNYSPQIIADLKKLTELPSINKIKIILTARKLTEQELLRGIKEYRHEEIIRIGLDLLKPEESKIVFEEELKKYAGYLNYVEELVTISGSRPILIVALIKAIISNKSIVEIKQDGFLKNYVGNYFDDFITKFNAETSFGREEVKSFISLMCLLEPINIKDSELIQNIITAENISINFFNRIFEELKKYHYVSGRFEMSIKPDYYSDIILSKAVENKYWVKGKTNLYPSQISNIIKNLVSIETATSDSLLVNDLLEDYIKSDELKGDYYLVMKKLSTVYSIAYSKPTIAIKALRIVIKSFSEIDLESYGNNYQLSSLVGLIKEILIELISANQYEESYSLLFELYIKTKDKSLGTDVFGFNRSDYLEGFTCKKQNFIFDKIEQILKHPTSDYVDFALNLCSSLLKLEYMNTRSSDYEKHQIVLSNYYVPEISVVFNLRFKIINLLTDFFNCESITQKDIVLNILLDIPREISSVQKYESYKGVQDINLVLDFLKKTSKQPIPLNFKEEIIDRTYWYVRWGIDDQFKEAIAEINKNLSPQNLTEELLRLYKRTEDSVEDDFSQLEDKFELQAKLLIEKNSVDLIANSLLEITSSYDTPPHYFYQFLNIIDRFYPEISKDLIEKIWLKDSSFVAKYSSGSLKRMFFTYNENIFYWQYINKLLEMNTTTSLNCILNIYSFFDAEEAKKITIQHTDVIDGIYLNPPKGTEYLLAFAIPSLIYTDVNRGIFVLKEYLNKCSQKDCENVFRSLFEMKEYKNVQDELLNHVIKFNLTYAIEKAFNDSIKRNGHKNFLNLMIQRFEYKKNVIKRDYTLGYEYVPKHRTNIYNDVSENTQFECFVDLLEWYINYPFDPMDGLYCDDILEYLVPSKIFNQRISEIYTKLIEKYEIFYPIVLNIASSLQIFNIKNEVLVNTIISVFSKGLALSKTDEEEKNMRRECYIAITSAGVKSGTPGQPFSFDVQLKDLLESIIVNYTNNFEVNDLLSKIIVSMKKQIQNSLDENQW
jgi:hypothetical protein